MLCWDFNGKNVHILNRITENAQTKEVKEGQKKKKQLGATAAGKYAAPNNPCLISPPKISRHREEIPSWLTSGHGDEVSCVSSRDSKTSTSTAFSPPWAQTHPPYRQKMPNNASACRVTVDLFHGERLL